MNSDLIQFFNSAVKVCKEEEYKRLSELLENSYKQVIIVEAQSRRKKSSTLIKGIQLIDRELFAINFQYEIVKKRYNINSITALDEYIVELEKVRKSLVKEKDSLK